MILIFIWTFIRRGKFYISRKSSINLYQRVINLIIAVRSYIHCQIMCSAGCTFNSLLLYRLISESCLPLSQKAAIVVPIAKKANLKNFRQVFNLTLIFKLLQRAISRQLRYLNNSIPDSHSAFRKFHSMEIAQLKVYSNICGAFSDGTVILLALLKFCVWYGGPSQSDLNHHSASLVHHCSGLCHIWRAWFNRWRLTDSKRKIVISQRFFQDGGMMWSH